MASAEKRYGVLRNIVAVNICAVMTVAALLLYPDTVAAGKLNTVSLAGELKEAMDSEDSKVIMNKFVEAISSIGQSK